MNRAMTACTAAHEAVPPVLPIPLAADLQDHLRAAGLDLERLQRLLADTCDTLLARFHATLAALEPLAEAAAGTDGRATAREAMRQLALAVTALQFQDLSSQLIAHTSARLHNCADQIASAAFGIDEDGEAVVAPLPERPNPVTQDEMDAGSIELF
jgi:hypothetical protein